MWPAPHDPEFPAIVGNRDMMQELGEREPWE